MKERMPHSGSLIKQYHTGPTGSELKKSKTFITFFEILHAWAEKDNLI